MFTFRILHLNNYFFLSHTLFAQLSLHFHLTRQRRWQRGGSVGCMVAASAERQRPRSSRVAMVGSFAAASAALGRQRQRSGSSVGRAAEAAQQWSCDGGQFCGGVGSARAAEAVQRRHWIRRRQLGSGGQRGGRAASAGVAERWRRRQHGVGVGTVAEAEAAAAQSPLPRRATDSAINCNRTAWRRSSVPLRNEGLRRIAGGICYCRLSYSRD